MALSFNRPPFVPKGEDRLTRSLYGGILRPLLPLAASRPVSALGGLYASSAFSRSGIKSFIKNNNIDMTGYEDMEFKSFNDFFTRPIIPSLRPVDMEPWALVSPCDGQLTAYEISDGLRFEIKGGSYSVESLLKNPVLAEEFRGGLCLVYRLAVDNLHRYIYFDGGTKGGNIPIRGRYYSVRPFVLDSVDFYKENTREYTVMTTRHFGRAVQVEVGATFVGRISNRHGVGSFERGEEKGMFEFGGSTIVLLLKRGAAQIDGDIMKNSLEGYETKVKLGERVGVSLKG